MEGFCMSIHQMTLSKKLLLLLYGFIALFLLRFAYSYFDQPRHQQHQADTYVDTSGFELKRKNYASKKMVVAHSSAQTVTQAVDQKYEKIGTLTNATEQYDNDEKKLYQLIQQQALMIQLEQRVGLSGHRQLNIALGVVPDKFDAVIEQLKKIGDPKSIQIDKKDKTNEYKTLEAERLSLQKARDALLEIKQGGGNMGDMITVTNRLLDIEKQIQALGVNLGEFDEENEFCTVKFSLKESKAYTIEYSFFQRIFDALSWAFLFYLGLLVIISFGLFSLWLFINILEKASQFSITHKNNNK